MRKLVPAWLPFIPLSAIRASMAVVSSIDTPAAFATGATYFMEFWKDAMSKAELLKLAAITSVTRCVSLASKPKPRKVAPATSADCARSEPVACARFSVASVTSVISSALKPSFAYSSCKAATSEAVNRVVLPNALAFSSSFLNSAPVAPETAFTLAMLCSKSAATLNDAAPINASGAVMPMLILRPRFWIFLVAAPIVFLTLPSAVLSPRVSAPILTMRSPNFAILFGGCYLSQDSQTVAGLFLLLPRERCQVFWRDSFLNMGVHGDGRKPTRALPFCLLPLFNFFVVSSHCVAEFFERHVVKRKGVKPQLTQPHFLDFVPR